MMKLRKLLALLLVLASLMTLTGCHGSRGLDPFVPPQEFDTSRDFEISFWAKNDTNLAQTRIYEKAIALGMIPMEEAEVVAISPVIPEAEPEAPWWENISWFMKGLFA